MRSPRLVTWLHRLIDWLIPPPTAAEQLHARMSALEDRLDLIERRLEAHEPDEHRG